MAEQNLERFYDNPYLFNAKELDRETGLYYYGARYYNPKLSIWYGVDPLAEKMPSWSPYAYTFNNPVKFTDPTGMEPDDWVKRNGLWNWEENITSRKEAMASGAEDYSDGKTNNTYTAENGAFVTLGSGGASDWTADYTDVNRDRLYSAIANCEVCQQIEKGEQFLFVEVPLIALTGGSGLTYYEGVALRGVTDMGMQYLFKKEIDYKQTAINAFVGGGTGNTAVKRSLYNYIGNNVNNNFNSYRQGGYEQVRKDVPINTIKALTGAFGMGIGNYHNNYWGSYVLPNLYSNAIDLNIDIYVK